MCGTVDYILAISYSHSCELVSMSIDYLQKLDMIGILL